MIQSPLSRLCEKIIGKSLYRLLRWICYPLIQAKTKYTNRERTISPGSKNPGKTFYVIRRKESNAGLFSYLMTILGHLKTAEKRNLIPVVDMMNYHNIYTHHSAQVNPWELFFSQPSPYSLSDVYESHRVILSNLADPIDGPPISMDFFNNVDGIRSYWKKIFDHYIQVRPHIKNEAKNRYRQLFSANDTVLGVLCRGSDYTVLQPHAHPVQPSLEQVKEEIILITTSYHCNRIFLATEDESIYRQLKLFFGNTLQTSGSAYVNYSGKGHLFRSNETNKQSPVDIGQEYLMDMLMLSFCDCILAGRTSGAMGVALMNDHFRYEKYWDLGQYK